MADVTKFTVEMLPAEGEERGRTFEVETRSFMCSADRYAFERQFPGETAGALTGVESDIEVFKEAWSLFFVWRVLRREHGLTEDFEPFAEAVLETEFPGDEKTDEEGGGPDPTEGSAPPPGS
jgi:hypothetical protein